MRYCIVYLAEGEIEKYFKEITSLLSQKFNIRNLSERIPPHITLKYPFEYEEEKLGEIEKNIENAIAGMKPIDFIVEGFSKFINDSKTIFLKVAKRDDLISLIKDCKSKLGSYGEDKVFDVDNFEPHISIARNLSVSESDKIWEYLIQLEKPLFNLKFDNVSILEWQKNDTWKVLKTYRKKQ